MKAEVGALELDTDQAPGRHLLPGAVTRHVQNVY
jgi:hypothetical protein